MMMDRAVSIEWRRADPSDPEGALLDQDRSRAVRGVDIFRYATVWLSTVATLLSYALVGTHALEP
jgi:hypothetical protein